LVILVFSVIFVFFGTLLVCVVGDFSTAVESSGISSEKIGVVWIGREREVVIEDECVVRGEVERSDFCETLWEFFVFF